jgi:hypothetical protein
MIRSTVVYGIAVLSICGCSGEFPTDARKLQAAEEAYDRELLIESLNQIEAWHVDNETGVVDVLGHGRTPSSIVVEFAGTDCRPTEELKSLWAWRDGGIGPAPFVWYHDFLPLKEALSEYKSLLLNPFVQWDPHYIPVFSFEGEWYAAYCGNGVSTAGPIAHFFVEDEPLITHVNLTIFMASMAETLRSGAVRWESDSMVDDILKVRSIHQRYNRGYDFPYYVADGT